MLQNLFEIFSRYYTFYGRFFSEQWHHMSPIKYASLLIGIGGFGWLLMKAANKRS